MHFQALSRCNSSAKVTATVSANNRFSSVRSKPEYIYTIYTVTAILRYPTHIQVNQ